VRDPASHADLVALALDTYGSLDMAFNNAGVRRRCRCTKCRPKTST
jgi:NAD(P)-dependent dehydrogenase (short-subunit alcohol dehydrogenase family)